MPSNGPDTWNVILKRYGFSAVVALILLGMLAGWVPSPLLSIAKDVTQANHDHATVIDQHEKALKLFRIMCYSQSRDSRCLE